MPTVLRIGRFRFYFFSNEREEPAHIHVKAAENLAKFWLNPTQLASSYGFSSRELNELERLVEQNGSFFLEVWNEYFRKH
jgi:subtilase family serine protease